MLGQKFLISLLVGSCGFMIGSVAQFLNTSGLSSPANRGGFVVAGQQSVTTIPLPRNSQNNASALVPQIPFGPDAMDRSTDLRGPLEKPATNDQSTVSAAQLRVPKKARQALQKAMNSLAKGNSADAARGIDEALDLCPQFSEALAARALSEQNSNPAQALSDAEKALEYDPNYGGGYVASASIFTTLHRPDDAIRTLQRASGITPAFWPVYYEMGRALTSKGEYTAALRQIEKACSLAPRCYPFFRLAKADIFIGLRDDSAAATELRAYLKEEPQGRRVPEAKLLLDKLQATTPRE
jgi:tetratricopeptide (TPR) repeat protein